MPSYRKLLKTMRKLANIRPLKEEEKREVHFIADKSDFSILWTETFSISSGGVTIRGSTWDIQSIRRGEGEGTLEIVANGLTITLNNPDGVWGEYFAQ